MLANFQHPPGAEARSFIASPTVLLTPNFQIQYGPAEYSGPGEIAAVQARAEAFVTGCEADYATLCVWFGVAVGSRTRRFQPRRHHAD
jgi:hypothetical protein